HLPHDVRELRVRGTKNPRQEEDSMNQVRQPRVLCLAGLLLAALGVLDAKAQAPVPAPTAFEGARLITGDGSVIENSAFLVDGNRIAAVGRRGELSISAGTRRVELAGKTVMPALVDAH